MKKLNFVLGIVLILQVVLSVFLLWPRTSASTPEAPLLSGFAAGDVVALTISDNDDNHIVLAKGNESWNLPEADDFPAQADKISPVLEKVGELNSNRLVTRTASSHKRLQVAEDDFNRLLDIEMKDGSHHKLYIGSSAGAGATHVRADDQPEVYLTASLDPWDANVQTSNWIDTLYFSVPQTATVALSLENAHGTFDFVRDDENWTMAGLGEDEQFNQSAFSTLLGQATTMRMAEPLGKELKPEYGLDKPQAVLTITTEIDGVATTYTAEIGAKDEEDYYVLHVSSSPYYVRVSGYLGDGFVQKKRADLIAVPATPEAVLPVDLDTALEMVPGATVSPTLQESPEITGEVPSAEPVITVTMEASPAATPTVTAMVEASPAASTATTVLKTAEPEPTATVALTATP